MDRITYERRRVLPGFPKEGKFKTMAEVDAYLSGEKIQCLLCGKMFHMIGAQHLQLIHGLTADDYREQYGIPWGRGLIGARRRGKCVLQAKKLIDEGKFALIAKGEPYPFKINPNKRPVPDCVIDSKTRWKRKDFEALLESIREQQRTLQDVFKDSDLPSGPEWRGYVKRNPEFARKLREVNHRLPYYYQSLIFDFSPRFRIDCERLRTRGMAKEKIAEALGVSISSVSRATRVLDEKMGLTGVTSDKLVREDFEAILDRIHEQQRPLSDVCGDPDLPSTRAWFSFIKSHPEFPEKLRKIYHDLPYTFQCKVKNYSPRFRIDCERLHAAGTTKKNIAKALGASIVSVRGVLRDLDVKMGTARPKPRKWSRKDFEAILDRIRDQQRPLVDVCRDPDLPNLSIWSLYANRHPEFAVKLQEIYHSLPYSFQGRVRNFSPRFRVDCERRRAAGMSLSSIAKNLGVSCNVVGLELKDFDEKMGIVRPNSRTWGREDFEAILDRIRKQQRSLSNVCGDPDLPDFPAWIGYVKKYPEFAEKLQEVYHSLPYSFQSKVKTFSPRLRVDCERRRAAGMSFADIAKKLGVSIHLVSRVLEAFDEKTGMALTKQTKWCREDYEAILNRIREQKRALGDVCGDPDLPSNHTWIGYVKKHPEFAEKLQEVYHSLPYSFQSRVRNFSPRFRTDCERLRAGGMTIKDIAKKLEVSYHPVERVLRDFDDEHVSRKGRKRGKDE